MDTVVKDDRVGDIILMAGEPFRYFVFDRLVTVKEVPVSEADFSTIETQASINVNLKDDDRRWMYQGRSLRCNVLTSLGKRQICMRVVKRDPPTFATSDFPENARLRELVTSKKEGMILVGGKPHSGKSTTCSAIIAEFARRHTTHVVTFENPVEAIFSRDLPSLITQRDMTDDMEDELKAIKSSVRQVPGLLFIQEIRDPSTAYLALALVSLGNRVIATTHAEDAGGVVTSFLKWLPKDRWSWGCFMLSQYLVCSIAQKLEYAQDNTERRYVLHQVLGKSNAVSAIIGKAADDEKSLKDLSHEIKHGGTNSDHVTWEMSIEAWEDKNVVFDPHLREQLSQ